jgi:hypothetical protein
MALAGAENTYCLDWGSGQVPPLVRAVSRLVMERSTPASNCWAPGPRAVAGSSASRAARALPAGKLLSPAKARVTGFPLPSQSGSSGDLEDNGR